MEIQYDFHNKTSENLQKGRKMCPVRRFLKKHLYFLDDQLNHIYLTYKGEKIISF